MGETERINQITLPYHGKLIEITTASIGTEHAVATFAQMNTISFFHHNLHQMAATVCAAIQSNSVLAFYGGMGLGKTTCITAICKQLGVFEPISSPTYSIINQYQTASGSRIYHMDWYRLADEAEAVSAGVEDALYSGDLCFVEWPEIAPNLLPINTLHFRLSQNTNGERVLFWS